MTLFIIVSGYLWKDKEIDNFQTLKQYIVKKIKRLYIPYVVCNGIAVLLNNILLHIGVYSNDNTHYFSFGEIIIRIIKVMLFNNETEIFGAMWFLRLLFSITTMYAIIEYMLNKIKIKKILICRVSIAIIFLILGFWLSDNQINLRIVDNSMFTCYIFFELGRILKNIRFKMSETYKIFIGIGTLIIICILNNFGTIEISKNVYTNIIYFLTVSIVGFIFVYELSYFILKNKYISSFFAYLGKNTMTILKGHFIAFKILSLMIYYIIYKTISFNKIQYNNIWILYTIFGIVFPILISVVFKIIFERRGKNERNNIYNTGV